MRRVVVLAEAAEDLEAARAFYNAQEAVVGGEGVRDAFVLHHDKGDAVGGKRIRKDGVHDLLGTPCR